MKTKTTAHPKEVELKQFLNDNPFTCAIVVSRFNTDLTSAMLNGVKEEFKAYGIKDSQLIIKEVPGAYELPFGAQQLIYSEEPDVVICLGVVIQGDTPHFDYVCNESARGIQDVALKTGVPVIFGVLTTNTYEEAETRANPEKDNKGGYCAQAAIEMAYFCVPSEPES